MKKQDLYRNMAAYLEDVENGKFKDAKPGTWVAYFNGKFVLSGSPKKDFLIKLRKIQTGCYYTQVNIIEEPIDPPSIIEVTERKGKKTKKIPSFKIVKRV